MPFVCARENNQFEISIRPTKKKMFVSCNMPKKVRVGRSAFKKADFVGNIGGKIRFAKTIVKNCENSVFRVIYVKKKSRVGAIS